MVHFKKMFVFLFISRESHAVGVGAGLGAALGAAVGAAVGAGKYASAPVKFGRPTCLLT